MPSRSFRVSGDLHQQAWHSYQPAAVHRIRRETKALQCISAKKRLRPLVTKYDDRRYLYPTIPDANLSHVLLDPSSVGKHERELARWLNVKPAQGRARYPRVRGARIDERLDPLPAFSAWITDLQRNAERTHQPIMKSQSGWRQIKQALLN